ncbi:MAG: helix-turn-helix domain-containing protein [Candidatus Omnitrophica bacterium]|nr:helix-turn-helix domain-containing protein [Candidatus Omnitrophota bacterium]MDD5351621.1 helix-turn-helix domain-containing protein [Candidatus Omnitrophota bacterium]MDD5550831.1 helix-turn-helix domain-containing protein [Candidatus Omnitrophota bacterium]
MGNKGFMTTKELANVLGISRIAVFNRIKKGQIKATKIGGTYLIPLEAVPYILGRALNETQRRKIDEAVAKTVKEYGETLRLLGNE